MPRSLRVFVEGGIYHVYNRFASGEPVFADPEEAREFIELLRFVKQRFVVVATNSDRKLEGEPGHRQSGPGPIVTWPRMTTVRTSMCSEGAPDRSGKNCRRRSTSSEAPPSFTSMWPTSRAALGSTT